MSNPIFDLENWREIGATLAQNKTRTFMTAFGVFWGTAMLALLLGGSDGFQKFMGLKFEGFATNTAIIFPNRTTKNYKGFNKGMEVKLNDRDVSMVSKAVTGLDHVSAINQSMTTAKYGKKKSTISLVGVNSEYRHLFTPIVYEGRFLNNGDDSGERKVCVLGKKISNELFGVGSPVGKDVSIDEISYKVVGVAGQTSEINVPSKVDESVIISNELFRRNYNQGDNVGVILFSLKTPHKPREAEALIRHIISQNHPISPDDKDAVFFFDISENFEMMDNLFIGITMLALFVGLGTLLSGVIGVGNIMWIIVRERTQEIGVRRALGAKPRDIIIQILCEGIVMTLVAGVAGICFATAILAVVDSIIPGIGFQMSFTDAVGITFAFVILGSAAGLIPAVRAMKIKPIEALNSK